MEAGKQFRICLGLEPNLFCLFIENLSQNRHHLGCQTKAPILMVPPGLRGLFLVSRDEVGDIGGCEHSHNSMQFFRADHSYFWVLEVLVSLCCNFVFQSVLSQMDSRKTTRVLFPFPQDETIR